MIPPALFFFPRLALAAWGSFVLLYKLKFFCLHSVKNATGDLIGIVLIVYIALGRIVSLMISVLPIQEHGRSFLLFVSSLISFISIL